MCMALHLSLLSLGSETRLICNILFKTQITTIHVANNAVRCV